ncbi:ABC transporter ATP-binding protein [Brucella gallinifaecis]|uniref:ABC transporter ATP-binding protein n=2 Tax=Brucella gallinifaecis TaxID=215590 RepID=A0A502BL70_9HYPH|nr:ABC transporter ATP-binding protein [Brucella gallinifaecis]
MAAMQPHVRMTGIIKDLDAFRAVDNISLDIPRGSMLTLLGPSGCGKSTTLRLLAGFYQPTQGDIFLGDECITALPPNRRRMTMVFQEYALFPHLSVARNVAYGLVMRKTPKEHIRKRVGEMLELVGLEGAAEKYPHQLSGGQQQRVALARALAVDPEVLLLDEPLSNLDAKLRIKLREEIVRLQKVLGKTMVFVTHDQEEALSISDRIAVMNKGRIEQLGSPTEIYYHPATRYVAEFIGLANFIDASVRTDGMVEIAGAVIPGLKPLDGPATAVIRPESVKILSGAAPAGAPTIAGRVTRRAFLGGTLRYTVETDFGEWTVDEAAPEPRPQSDEVRLVLPVERLHLIPRG